MRSAQTTLGLLLVLAMGAGACDVGKFMAAAQKAARAERERRRKLMTNAPELSVNADELVTDYSQNQLAAESKYKDKVLEVTGPVGRVRRDFGDEITVELGEDMVDNVECTLPQDASEVAMALKRGDEIKVKGLVDNVLLGSVMLDPCEVLTAPARDADARGDDHGKDKDDDGDRAPRRRSRRKAQSAPAHRARPNDEAGGDEAGGDEAGGDEAGGSDPASVPEPSPQ